MRTRYNDTEAWRCEQGDPWDGWEWYDGVEFRYDLPRIAGIESALRPHGVCRCGASAVIHDLSAYVEVWIEGDDCRHCGPDEQVTQVQEFRSLRLWCGRHLIDSGDYVHLDPWGKYGAANWGSCSTCAAEDRIDEDSLTYLCKNEGPHG